MTRILIADDHAIVREGLKQIIARAPDMTVTAEATDGNEAVGKAVEENCDVLLLDISMPGRSGFEALKLIKARNPKLAILMLSVHPEETYAARALKAGASGYLTKDSTPERLIEAIRKVSLGGRYVSPSLAERLAQELELGSQISPHERLSDREFQVLRLLASGRTIKEIAAELSLGVPSVSTYRARIIGKMKFKNVAELTSYAIRNRLAD